LGRRICLVGFSEINRMWAMKQPKAVELWGLNEVHNCVARLQNTDELGRVTQVHCRCYNPHQCTCESHKHSFMPRYDRWFQLHPKAWKEEKRLEALKEDGLTLDPRDRGVFGRNESHLKFLRECDVAVYGQRKWADIPNSVRYPFGAVQELYGQRRGSKKWLYSTSTPAYMIALALYEHHQGDTVDEIRIAGIELTVGTEYFWQRPCMEFYMGIAIGYGIKVTTPPQGSSMLAAPRYILDDPIPVPTDYKHESFPLSLPTDRQIEEHGLPQAAMDDGAAKELLSVR
jgi:hypothetical protein